MATFTDTILFGSLMLRVVHSIYTFNSNLDLSRSLFPYFMNMNGMGIAKLAMPPKIDIAGPTPRFWNMGRANMLEVISWRNRNEFRQSPYGNPAARIDRKKVFAETALAAYRP